MTPIEIWPLLYTRIEISYPYPRYLTMKLLEFSLSSTDFEVINIERVKKSLCRSFHISSNHTQTWFHCQKLIINSYASSLFDIRREMTLICMIYYLKEIFDLQNLPKLAKLNFIAILQLHRKQIARSTRVWLEICTGVAIVAKLFHN